eukprot:10007243-Alexandrium_andersonii.AAC.1
MGDAAEEEEVLDLAATQPMEVDESRSLRKTPHGSGHQDSTEGEQRWIKEEQEVREWALARSERWQTMPLGSGGDSEAFE